MAGCGNEPKLTEEQRSAQSVQQLAARYRAAGMDVDKCFSGVNVRSRRNLYRPAVIPKDAKILCAFEDDFGADEEDETIALAAASDNNRAWLYTAKKPAQQDSDLKWDYSIHEIEGQNFQLHKFSLSDMNLDKWPHLWPQVIFEYTTDGRRKIAVYKHDDKMEKLGKFRYNQIAHAEGDEFCVQNLDFYADFAEDEIVVIKKTPAKSAFILSWKPEMQRYQAMPFASWLQKKELRYIRRGPRGVDADEITADLLERKKSDIDMLYKMLLGMEKEEASKETAASLTEAFVKHIEGRDQQSCGIWIR